MLILRMVAGSAISGHHPRFEHEVQRGPATTVRMRAARVFADAFLPGATKPHAGQEILRPELVYVPGTRTGVLWTTTDDRHRPNRIGSIATVCRWRPAIGSKRHVVPILDGGTQVV